jgi:hypothetical protein
MKTWVLAIGLLTFSTGLVADELDQLELKSPYGSAENAGQIYALVDLRHYNNVYGSAEQSRTEPSVHLTSRVGRLMMGKSLDISVLFGAIKVPNTKKIIARRPEVELDFLPLQWGWGYLVQYAIVELPFSESDYDASIADPANQGSVWTVGLSTVNELPLGADNFRSIFGLDGWTKSYSRRQYVDANDALPEDRQYFLDRDEAGEKPVEDDVYPLFTQAFLGLAYNPSFLSPLWLETRAHLLTHFVPRYFESEVDDHVGAKHVTEKRSFFLFRARLHLTQRMQFLNDFYYFHDGYFEAAVKDPAERRIRNLGRVVYFF